MNTPGDRVSVLRNELERRNRPIADFPVLEKACKNRIAGRIIAFDVDDILDLLVVCFRIAVIAGGCSPAAKLPARLLGTRLMVGIGLISYSLYLWHWSVIVIARWTIGVFWWSAPFLVAIMFLTDLVQ